MLLVLGCLAELKSAESGRIADELGLNRKHVSVMISRCHSRGFVSGKPFKRGRIRGFVYKLTDEGINWMRLKAQEKNVGSSQPLTPGTGGSDRKSKPKMVLPTTIPDRTPQDSTDSVLPYLSADCALQTADAYRRAYEQLKERQNDLYLACALLVRRLSEVGFVLCKYMEEHDMNLKTSTTSQSEKAGSMNRSLHSDTSQFRLGYAKGRTEAWMEANQTAMLKLLERSEREQKTRALGEQAQNPNDTKQLQQDEDWERFNSLWWKHL
jgi:DNA-binding MarR family transcriptional regulator